MTAYNYSDLSSCVFILSLLSQGLISVNVLTGEVFKNFGAKSGLLTGNINSDGYIVYKITDLEHNCKLLYGHQIVFIAQYGFIPTDCVLDHKNGIKTDNRIDNLEPVTHAENCRRAAEMGLSSKNKTILTPDQRKDLIEDYKTGKYSINCLAKMYGIERRTVSAILRDNEIPKFPPGYWNKKTKRE